MPREERLAPVHHPSGHLGVPGMRRSGDVRTRGIQHPETPTGGECHTGEHDSSLCGSHQHPICTGPCHPPATHREDPSPLAGAPQPVSRDPELTQRLDTGYAVEEVECAQHVHDDHGDGDRCIRSH